MKVGVRGLGRIGLVVTMLASTIVAGSQVSGAQNASSGQSSKCSPGEIASRRTRVSKTVLHEDCTYTTTFGGNLHYEVDPGRWEEVDLRFRADGNDHVADRNTTIVRVSGARLQVTDRDTRSGIGWVLPGPPSVAGHRAGFSWRGLQWEYLVTDFGIKLQAEVGALRGPQTYEFPYQLLGTANDLVVDARGDLRGAGFYIPRAFALGADGKTYEAGPWRLLQGRRVAFDFDDSALPPEAVPYVLDPTTSFAPGAAGDEGDITKFGSPYPPGSCSGWSDSASTIVPSRNSNAKPDHYWITNGFMSWDTASLPDAATVTSSSLKFYSREKSNANSRKLTADWYSAWPIDCSDFSDTAQTTAIGGVPLADIQTPNSSTIVNLSGAPGGVSLTGRTGLRTHIDGGQPLGQNYVEIYQLGNTANMGTPNLNVTYSVPGGAPTILSATDSPDPVTAGATTTFTVGWSDPDVGDQVRALICKTSVTSGGQCANGAWASGGRFSSSPSTAALATSTSIVGTNTYYAFACDDAGACSNALSGTFAVSPSNTTPAITSVTDSPDPVPAGFPINFAVGWADSDAGDAVKVVICKTNSISAGSCSGGAWASGSLSSFSPASASLTTSSAIEGSNPYYAFVCDQANACSASSLGIFTVSPPNAAPGITSAADSADPVTEGQPVSFTVGWSDSNAGDAVKAVVCKTNAVSAGSCSGGTWASGSLSAATPASASFTTASADIGTHTYYAFACDQWSACSGSLSGTFTVAPSITSERAIGERVTVYARFKEDTDEDRYRGVDGNWNPEPWEIACPSQEGGRKEISTWVHVSGQLNEAPTPHRDWVQLGHTKYKHKVDGVCEVDDVFWGERTTYGHNGGYSKRFFEVPMKGTHHFTLSRFNEGCKDGISWCWNFRVDSVLRHTCCGEVPTLANGDSVTSAIECAYNTGQSECPAKGQLDMDALSAKVESEWEPWAGNDGVCVDRGKGARGKWLSGTSYRAAYNTDMTDSAGPC